MKRCSWCNEKNEVYVHYHDEEWGVLNLEDPYLFEMLILESFQAGLSWECILNKREAFRQAFDHFDWRRIQGYGEDKIDSLCQDPGIVRNRSKIKAAITNAKVFEEIRQEKGSFRDYLLEFTRGKIYYETHQTHSKLSDALSQDLKKRGMKFVGATILYAYLQAIGIVNSHEEGCFLYVDPKNQSTRSH